MNIFLFKKKAMLRLKKMYFRLSRNFQTCFYLADHVLYYPQMSVSSFYTFFVLLSVS